MYVTLNSGIRLRVQVDGAEDRPWLMLSNSLGTDIGLWDPQMSALTSAYRVLRYDTRGHGESEVPPGPYTFEDLVGDAIGLMDHFGMRRPAFMGTSLGGMTGLGVALTQPDRLERLICCGARASAPPAAQAIWDTRLSNIRKGGLAAVLDDTIPRWMSAPYQAANPENVARMTAMMLRTPVEGYAACVSALKELDYLDRLQEIKVPTLFVVGSEDTGAPPEVMRDMSKRVLGSQFVELEGGSHLANVDSAESFVNAVKPFLGLGDHAAADTA